MEKKNTKLILLRHGESLANAEHIYIGHADWDLSALGKKQADIIADFLKDEKVDYIYSSDLIRAYNTALPSAKLRGMEIIKSTALREIDLGVWQGMKVEEIKEKWDKEFKLGWVEGFGTFCPPGGESIPHLAERIKEEVTRIAKKHYGKTVIIACHAAAIRAFWGKITFTPAEEVASKIPFPHNASCSIVDFDGEKLVPVEYDIHHYLDTGKPADA